MLTQIIWKCSNWKRHPVFPDAKDGYSLEKEVVFYLEDDYSGFRKGFPVLSKRARKIQDSLDREWDNAIVQEINGKTWAMPKTILGSGFEGPRTLAQIRNETLAYKGE